MSTQRLIGRLDPNTGDVIETDGRRRGGKPLGETSVPVKAAPNKPVKIQQFIPVERKFCGATYLFDAISDKLGLTSDLKSCFPATYKMLLSIAYYLIPEDSAPLFRFGEWASLHTHPYGRDIQESLSDGYTSKAEKILESYNIDKDGLIAKDSHLPLSIIKPELSAGIEEKQIRHLITEYNRGRDRMTKLKYASSMLEIEEGTAKCCYISVDDIGVRFQKSKRKQKCKKGKSFVENTVIHIQSDGKQYTLTAVGMDKAFKLLIAFLLENKLMEGSRLIFFSDGATCIRDTIEKYFGFRQYTLVLDWLHLEKKCNEFLSMGIKGAKDEKLQINKRISTQIICIIARIALPLHKIICNDVIDRRLYIYKFLEAAYSCSCVQSVGPLFIFYIIINSK